MSSDNGEGHSCDLWQASRVGSYGKLTRPDSSNGESVHTAQRRFGQRFTQGWCTSRQFERFESQRQTFFSLFERSQPTLPETRQTPLHVAVDSDRIDVAELLLLNGANVNAVNRPNMDSPLHLVKSVELAELLMKSGASLASQNAWFQTPLHCACKSGNAALVKCLVSSRGELDAKDQQGRTPLHYCSAGNRNLIAKCLIESGCNISELDAEGISALALAELMGFQDVAKEIRSHQQLPSSAPQSMFFEEK